MTDRRANWKVTVVARTNKNICGEQKSGSVAVQRWSSQKLGQLHEGSKGGRMKFSLREKMLLAADQQQGRRGSTEEKEKHGPRKQSTIRSSAICRKSKEIVPQELRLVAIGSWEEESLVARGQSQLPIWPEGSIMHGSEVSKKENSSSL